MKYEVQLVGYEVAVRISQAVEFNLIGETNEVNYDTKHMFSIQNK